MPRVLLKTCEICHQLFQPDYRVIQKQTVCDKLKCRRERKRRSQKKWLAKNPNYFKGRYPQLKDNIIKRREALKASSASQNSSDCKAFNCIQDELTVCKNKPINIDSFVVSIQDEITFKISTSNQELLEKKIVYKTIEPIVFY